MLSVTCVVFFAASVYSFHVNLENNAVAESISGDVKVDRLRRGAAETGGLEEAADDVDDYGGENAVQVRQKRYEIKEDTEEGKNDDAFPIRPRFGFFRGDTHGPRYPYHRGYPGQGYHGFPQHGPPHHRRPYEPHGYHHHHGYPHRHHPRPDCHGGNSKGGSDEYDYDNYDNNYKSSTTQWTRGTTSTSAPSTPPTAAPTTASTTTPTTTTPYPLIDVRSGER